MKVYIVMQNEFDGVMYYDKVVKVFSSLKAAEDFGNNNPEKLDYYIEEHEVVN